MQLRALVILGVVVALALAAQVTPGWATPGDVPHRQSVPTKTPTSPPPPPTDPPTVPPTPTEPPTAQPPTAPPPTVPPGATNPPGQTPPPGQTEPPPGTTATPAGTGPAPTPTRLSAGSVTPGGTVVGPAVTVSETLNVRAGPGTDFDILGQLFAGQVVPAVGRTAEYAWWEIVYEAAPGARAWVSGQFVVPNAEALALGVTWGTVTPTATSSRTATPMRSPTVPAPATERATDTPIATQVSPAVTARVTPVPALPTATPAPATRPPAGFGWVDVLVPLGFLLVVVGLIMWRLRRG